jgi:hypothetical protein
MNHYDFEARIPVDHVLHIISVVREEGVAGNTSKLMICLGSAIGELGAFLGTFGPSPVGDQQFVDEVPVDTMSLQDCCDALEKKFSVLKGLSVVKQDEAGIDPATIALLIQLALKLIELWRNRR